MLQMTVDNVTEGCPMVQLGVMIEKNLLKPYKVF